MTLCLEVDQKSVLLVPSVFTVMQPARFSQVPDEAQQAGLLNTWPVFSAITGPLGR